MTRTAIVGLLVVLAGCGSAPSPADATEAAKSARNALDAADRAKVALELLGLLPSYSCGQPRRTVAIGQGALLATRLQCAKVTARAGDTFDALEVEWTANCPVNGHQLGGVTVFRYSGGDDRFDITADLSRTTIDSEALNVTGSYGQCGDEKRYSATARGSLKNGQAFDTSLSVGQRAGLPLIGSTSLMLNGSVTLQATAGVDQLTLDQVLYEIGEFAPHSGSIHARNAKGQSVEVRFSHALWKLGSAEVFLDGEGPFVVPLIQ